MVATNGSNTFYIPSFTIHNDSSCVDPWVSDTYFWTPKHGDCQFDWYSGYYIKSSIKKYVPMKPSNSVMIRSHRTAWQCAAKKSNDVLEYRIAPLNECVIDEYSGLYMMFTSCDYSTNTVTINYYYGWGCYSVGYTITRTNIDHCASSSSLSSIARGFLSYSCL